MPTLDPRIDEYIAKAGAFARPMLKHFRERVHKIVPECEEAIKWSMPHFMLAGHNFAGMAAFKKHVSIFFHHDEQPGGTGKFRRIASLADLADDKLIEERLHGAIEWVTALADGKKVKTAPKLKAVPEMPAVFSEALSASGFAAHFADMAPGYRREYIDWIASAKTDATREKRLAQAVEWIGERKHRNWKYQNC